ncbi:hypothetical protein CKAN_00314000 [Cinnamomum micranthum f. kanehirae]|uniref:Uncharacterized protein n=1 Tax=Cinnamomum micranthum f. kanehirae TaxID=337451 RepID=A0A3S3N8M7_9MAGN|nr:hypothetical protein CKAN_00314000 [Cinnamomum micranthum f. kanehirae]
MGEQERDRDRGGVRDDKKDHRRSTGDHKNDNASNHEEFREHAESLTAGRDSSASRLKETYNSSSRELNMHKKKTGCKRGNMMIRNVIIVHPVPERKFREMTNIKVKLFLLMRIMIPMQKKLKALHSDKATDYTEDAISYH